MKVMLQIKLLLDAGVPLDVLSAGVLKNAILFTQRPSWEHQSEMGSPFSGFEGED